MLASCGGFLFVILSFALISTCLSFFVVLVGGENPEIRASFLMKLQPVEEGGGLGLDPAMGTATCKGDPSRCVASAHGSSLVF